MTRYLCLFVLGLVALTNCDKVDDFFKDYYDWKSGQKQFVDIAKSSNDIKKAVDRLRYDCTKFRRRKNFYSIRSRANTTTSSQKHFLNQIQFETDICLAGLEYRGYLLAPISFKTGVQAIYPKFYSEPQINGFNLDRTSGLSSLTRALKKLPQFLKNTKTLLIAGVEANVTYPREALRGTNQQFLELQVKNVEDSEFYNGFRNISRAVPAKEIGGLQSKAKSVLRETLLPSFQDLGNYLETKYSRHLRTQPGMVGMVNGTDMYKACLTWHTGIKDPSPESIHQTGLDQIALIRPKVMALASKLGYRGQQVKTMKQLFDKVGSEQGQTFQDKSSFLNHTRRLIEDKIQPVLSRAFEKRFLRSSLLDVSVEEMPPSDDGIAKYIKKGNKGTYYIQTRNLNYIKKFELLSLAMHESIPGHHLQFGVFNSLLRLPKFIKSSKLLGGYEICPAGPPTYTGFTEGWALYAEFLGIELGLFADPRDLLGYYSFNLLRACRLVVDTGVHYFGWSRQEMVDFIHENTALSREVAGIQADRYITWPGQATGYKLGELKIHELRRAEERRLGSAFDLPKFHTSLLSCMGALDSVEDCINAQDV